MHVIRATQQMLETRTLVIGFQGENLRTQLRIDCAATFAEYPNATPALAIKPPTGETYPVFVERDGNEVVWDIVANNLVLKGDGELQLTFYKDNVIAKTVIGTIRVNRSLQIDGEMPDVVATWIENANRKLAEVDAQIVELEGMVDTATDAAERAEQSASTASTAAEQAAGSASTATAQATEATTAAGTATAKAAEAEQSAQTATEKATAAAESERIATEKAGEATTAAGTATAKAEQATEAAQTAIEKAGDASASATAAQASATNAASSATAASASETAAKASETAASTSASQAATSAQGAGIAAQTATQKATEATQSATNAATSAGTATTNAEEAAASAQAAQDAKTAVEQTAEQLADSLEQIEQNTQDIADLDERKANIDGYYPDMTVGNAEQLNSSKFVENSEPYTLRTSGGTSDIGNREYLDAVVGGTLAWNQKVRDSASENSTDFADVVTVTDAVEDAAGVSVKIEPVQDLHGQDSPWPAGGGKNLFHFSAGRDAYEWSDGCGFSAINTDDYSVTLYGTASESHTFSVIGATITLKAGTYKLSSSANALMVVLLKVSDQSNIGNSFGSAFTLAEDTECQFNMTIISGSAFGTSTTVYIQIESGNTATEIVPYSNICPISGWDGVKVSRTGKNLLDESNLLLANGWTVTDGVYNGANSALHAAFINGFPGMAFKPDTVYTVSLVFRSTTASKITVIGFNYTDGTYSTVYMQDTVEHTVSFTSTSGKSVSNLLLSYGAGDTVYISQMQVEEGSTATDYEPYAGQVYDITLPTEAGTVYGGELTVNADGSGSLVVDRASVDLGTLTWNYTTDNRFFAVVSDAMSTNTDTTDFYCSAYAARAVVSQGSAWINRQRVFIVDSNYDSVSAFTSAMSGVQLVYELATPITYTLTPSQIRTLLGQNHIWSDAGQTALTYTGTDEHLTLENGKKYLTRINGTDSMLLGSGQEITAAKGTDNVFDLTKMFGTAVADYVYGQGASFFRRWFGKQWYPYNAGELKHVEGLQSHDMVGFNLLDLNRIAGNLKNTSFGQNTPRDFELDKYYVGLSSTNYYASSNISNHSVSENSVGVTSKSAGYGIAFPIRCFPETEYHIRANYSGSSFNIGIGCYDEDGNYIRNFGAGAGATTIDASFTTPSNCRIITVCFSTSAANASATYTDICINLSHNGSRNGEYEPYEKHSYPLDSTVVLRGIPKVDANGVYWDGDRYLPDGTVERRYGVVDLGTLTWVLHSDVNNCFYANVPGKMQVSQSVNLLCPKYAAYTENGTNSAIFNTLPDKTITGIDRSEPVVNSSWLYVKDTAYTDVATFKAAMSGVMLVYELETPTTETAQPYHSTQWVSDWGTEEFVSTGIVPVGTETRYPANLRDKLQHLPDAASGNGSYLITQTDGQMTLTPFPAPPSTAGNYVLKATVTGGVATYTWEVAT